MDWVESIHRAIRYMEDHLREELTIRDIAQQAALSPFYFQKGFAMLCGMTVGDYIRQRRLSVAGLEILTTDRKIIDIALEAGYDSPDSFTRAFARFHGVTPTALRKSEGAVRSFAPLKIKVTLEGGQDMDCKIMKKEAFTVLCRAKTFKYEDAAEQVPQFWAEHFRTGGGATVSLPSFRTKSGTPSLYWSKSGSLYLPRGRSLPNRLAIQSARHMLWLLHGPITMPSHVRIR